MPAKHLLHRVLMAPDLILDTIQEEIPIREIIHQDVLQTRMERHIPHTNQDFGVDLAQEVYLDI